MLTARLFRAARMRSAILSTARGGGFHKGDEPLYEYEIRDKRIDLEYVHREFYHDYAPEHLMTYEAMDYPNWKSAFFYSWYKVVTVVLPIVLFLAYICYGLGTQPKYVIRPGPEHEHMGPGLLK